MNVFTTHTGCRYITQKAIHMHHTHLVCFLSFTNMTGSTQQMILQVYNNKLQNKENMESNRCKIQILNVSADAKWCGHTKLPKEVKRYINQIIFNFLINTILKMLMITYNLYFYVYCHWNTNYITNSHCCQNGRIYFNMKSFG